MKNYIEPEHLIILAVGSLLLSVLTYVSFFVLSSVLLGLILVVSIIGAILGAGKNNSMIGGVLGGTFPIWILIFLFELFPNNLSMTAIRFCIVVVLCIVGVAALLKLWIQRVQEQKQIGLSNQPEQMSFLVRSLSVQEHKEIELANQRDQELRLQIQEKERSDQEQMQIIDELIQRALDKYTAQIESGEVSEPISIYKSGSSQIAKSAEFIQVKASAESKEILPPSLSDEPAVSDKKLFVNYHLDLPECTVSYAVLRIPQKDCIIRSHRYGKTKRRGFKEEAFQQIIEKYFKPEFLVSGNLRLNTGKETRPFEPDIALVRLSQDFNIRINIEIDEPYAGLTRQPTHCKGDDFMRDTYFVDRGWMVIRFSEYQVHTQEL